MRTTIGLVTLALFSVGCASDDETTPQLVAHHGSADPTGVYEDDYAASHRVDVSAWTTAQIDVTTWTTSPDVFTFVSFDSKLDLGIAQNAETNQFNPGKYSQFDWATDQALALRYCQVTYDSKSEAVAAAAPRADESNWEKGCSGFAWSTLTPPEILGVYADDWGGSHAITGQTWTMGDTSPAQFNLRMLSNTRRFLIAENAATNGYHPGKFSRFDWVVDPSGALYYCQTRYDAANEAEALASAAADSIDLTNGCATFAWTKMTPLAP